MIKFSMKLSGLGAFAVAALMPCVTANADPAFEPVSGYNPSSIFSQVGLPVGKLLIKTDLGPIHCTGFLVTQTHLITNEHCVVYRKDGGKQGGLSEHPAEKIELLLGYTDSSDSRAQAVYPVSLPPVEVNRALDYAVLEVRGDPPERFGFLSLSSAAPVENMPLWIIGHPGGKPQQISRIRCKSATPAIHSKNRLHHFCGTEPGSSGSPVIDATTRQVIAVNSAYFRHDGSGIAVPFSVIVPQSPFLLTLTGAPRLQ